MTKITKAEFDALPDSLKTKFKAEGEDYVLEEPDVTGLKKNKDELLQELKDLKAKYGDLDPEAARKALEAAQQAEAEDLAAKGKWEELEKKLRDAHAAELKTRDDNLAAMFDAGADKDLRLKLSPLVVSEEDAENLSIILRNKHIKPVNDGGKPVWKSLDDTQIIDLDTYLPTLKDNGFGRFFKANGASGSGASGSQGNGGNANTITAEQYNADPAKYGPMIGKGEVTVA